MSLLEISKLPTAENSVIHLHATDNVGIARVPLQVGQKLKVGGTFDVTVATNVPAGHKIALFEIQAGEKLIRYGQEIGHARVRIGPGEHVHTQNLLFQEIHFNYEFPSEEHPLPPIPANVPTFQGYVREDGRVGTRNYIAVVAASNCAAHTAELIAASYTKDQLPENVDGVVAFPHGDGCGQSLGPDTDQLRRTLSGVLDHPNVSAASFSALDAR